MLKRFKSSMASKNSSSSTGVSSGTLATPGMGAGRSGGLSVWRGDILVFAVAADIVEGVAETAFSGATEVVSVEGVREATLADGDPEATCVPLSQ